MVANEIETKNARIKGTHLGQEDHGIFTALLHLDYDGAGQSFGGYALDKPDKESGRLGTEFGCQFIMEVLDTLEVEAWEKLPGTPIRVRASFGKVYAIGHFIKNKWLDAGALAESYRNKDATDGNKQG